MILIQSGRVNDTLYFYPSRPFVLSKTENKQPGGKTITDNTSQDLNNNTPDIAKKNNDNGSPEKRESSFDINIIKITRTWPYRITWLKVMIEEQ